MFAGIVQPRETGDAKFTPPRLPEAMLSPPYSSITPIATEDVQVRVNVELATEALTALPLWICAYCPFDTKKRPPFALSMIPPALPEEHQTRNVFWFVVHAQLQEVALA